MDFSIVFAGAYSAFPLWRAKISQVPSEMRLNTLLVLIKRHTLGVRLAYSIFSPLLAFSKNTPLIPT